MAKDKKGKNFSGNNAQGQRKKSDFYETPYSITSHLLRAENFDKSLTVCEPACGEGAIVKVLEKEWKDVIAYDIEKDFFLIFSIALFIPDLFLNENFSIFLLSS